MTTRVLIHPTTPGESMEFEGLVTAAFWAGVQHSEDEVRSVTVSADPASVSGEGSDLQEFINLLVRREIDFSVDFLPSRGAKEVPRSPEGAPLDALEYRQGWDAGYLAELAELKMSLDEGHLTKSQYEENRKVLIAGWMGRTGKGGGSPTAGGT